MITPGPLSARDAQQLNAVTAWVASLKRSTGTGDGQTFQVGMQGINVGQEIRIFDVIQVVDSTPTDDGRYDSITVGYDELLQEVVEGIPVWLRELNGNVLTEGVYYLAFGTGSNNDGFSGMDTRAVYTTCVPATMAQCLDVTIEGITNGTCDSCEALNATFTLTYNEEDDNYQTCNEVCGETAATMYIDEDAGSVTLYLVGMDAYYYNNGFEGDWPFTVYLDGIHPGSSSSMSSGAETICHGYPMSLTIEEGDCIPCASTSITCTMNVDVPTYVHPTKYSPVTCTMPVLCQTYAFSGEKRTTPVTSTMKVWCQTYAFTGTRNTATTPVTADLRTSIPCWGILSKKLTCYNVMTYWSCSSGTPVLSFMGINLPSDQVNSSGCPSSGSSMGMAMAAIEKALSTTVRKDEPKLPEPKVPRLPKRRNVVYPRASTSSRGDNEF